MRKIILTALMLLALSSAAFSQAVTTTVSNKKSDEPTILSDQKIYTSTSLSLLRLDDGEDKLAAFALPRYTFANSQERVKLNLIGAYNPDNIKEKAYVGAALSLDIVDHKGFKATAYYGVRGYDFNNAALNFNRIYGFGVTIPIEKIGLLANFLR